MAHRGVAARAAASLRNSPNFLIIAAKLVTPAWQVSGGGILCCKSPPDRRTETRWRSSHWVRLLPVARVGDTGAPPCHSSRGSPAANLAFVRPRTYNLETQGVSPGVRW